MGSVEEVVKVWFKSKLQAQLAETNALRTDRAVDEPPLYLSEESLEGLATDFVNGDFMDFNDLLEEIVMEFSEIDK